MPSADKRQRKKDNARLAREARQAAENRRRRLRSARNAAIAVGAFALIIVLVNVFKGGGSKSSSSTSTTEAAASTTVPVVLPTGCVKTVPKTAKKPANLKAPGLVIDPSKTYTAKVSTTCGDVTIALDAKNTPKSVNNFVSLARQSFFDGLKWHRVADNPPVVQGGDPKGDGTGGPGYKTTVELPSDGKYPTGAVAWAKGGNDPDGSAGSQFFIDVADASGIGKHYGYIGKVTAGFDNVKKMATLAVPGSQSGAPAKPLYIFKVTITES